MSDNMHNDENDKLCVIIIICIIMYLYQNVSLLSSVSSCICIRLYHNYHLYHRHISVAECIIIIIIMRISVSIIIFIIFNILCSSRKLSLKLLKRRLSWTRHREVTDINDDGGTTDLADTPTIEENGGINYNCKFKKKILEPFQHFPFTARVSYTTIHYQRS